MSAITYKCPNCPSSLRLEPESQRFVCDYCGSSFTLDEIEKGNAQDKAPKAEFAKSARLYHCKGCGAEVFTDDTTAATFCVYCHSPIVLSEELSGDYEPDQVIPFKISKDKVTKEMMQWCKKKRFIDDAFFEKAQVEKLTGVYFPYFIVDGKTQGSLSGRGTKVQTWRQGNYRFTKTDIYHVEREGDLTFNDIPIDALNKDHTYILNGIQPFDQKKAIPFSMPYLSGFLADKRNISKDDALPDVKEVAKQSTLNRLNQSITGYMTMTSENESVTVNQTDFSYVLMPAWMLTYKYGEEKFYFAMNGDTGKIAGRVPLGKRKLGQFFAMTATLVTVIMMLVGWFI